MATCLGVATLLVLNIALVRAQSTDAMAPYPISSHDLSGNISARDIGDARMTHHYYAFGGNPGDVLITVQSRNLNGDVDVFTAGTLRPLLKFTLYAESSSAITKGIYLRRHEDLILRVEARTPNDDEGSYQIRFGGSFEPLAAPLIAEGEKTDSKTDLATRSVPRGRRVNSAGARINEPPPPPEEIAAVTPASAATPKPTPSPSPEASPEESPAPARATPTRRSRGRTPTRRTTTTPRPEASTAENKEPIADVTDPDKVAKVAEPEPARPPRRGTGRRATGAPAPAPAEPEPLSGPRLVLEMLDGTRVESFMSMIRRVTIENNQIVVVRKDGKINRTRLSDVLRMTIAP